MSTEHNEHTQGDNTVNYEVKSPILETLGISKAYKVGGTLVSPVTDVSMQVGYGDFCVIFGPSGAGKTTLLGMLMGLEKPDIGEVFFKGSSIFGYSEDQRTMIRRKRVSFLTQSQYWIEGMKLVDNVALPLYVQGWRRSKARKESKQILEKVGLHNMSNRNPLDLSAGEQQKAALARALIKKPWIIYADEPTAHLDSESVVDFTNLLLATSEELGITVVMVTHDLNFLKLSKKWFFMQDGRLWDIADKRNPFTDIRQAIAYIEGQEAENGGAL